MSVDWTSIINKLLDPYDVRARLFPGLLLLLPAILFLALLHGSKSPLVIGLSTAVMTCGGPYLLASFVRTWGLRAQDRLIKKWGAQPSTILLRHRDSTLAAATKQRYHDLAASRFGIAMPSAEEERLNPTTADDAYAAAADAMRPRTNDHKDFPFVFKELVSYGFNRNAHGSRWVGLAVAVVIAIATLVDANALMLDRPFVQGAALDGRHIAVMASTVIMSLLWCAHFTGAAVKLAGFAYAKRLWEALDQAPPKKAARSRREAVRGPAA